MLDEAESGVVRPMSEVTIEESVLQEASDGDAEFERDLLVTFLETTAEAVTQMEGVLAAQDFSSLEKLAHFVKGGAKSIGALALADAAAHLESAGNRSDLQTATEYVPAMVTAFNSVEAWIHERYEIGEAA